MSYLRKIQYHIAASILAAALLFPTAENLNKNPNILAWWGTIYPQFCFIDKPEATDKPAPKPKLHFWLAETIEKILY